MTVQLPKRFVRILPAGILVISLTVVYLTSMAPGLTWANYGADGGDLIAAAASGGVAHPTGYPLYLLLARVFQFLPIGSLAFRTNLMSAAFTICAAVLVYSLVTRSLAARRSQPAWLAGLVAGFAFGLAPLVWSQAVITEVYALQALVTALILYLAVTPLSGRFKLKSRDCGLGLSFGLAMGNHLTTLFLLPIVLGAAFKRKTTNLPNPHWWNEWLVDYHTLLRFLAWSGVGLLVYLSLPLRASTHPAVNWGNPVTLGGLGWLVSGRLYQGQLFNQSFLSILERFGAMAVQYLRQFGIPGLGFGLTGLIVFFKSTRLYFSMLWIAASSSIFALGYATADAFIYLIPAFLCFAIWIGMGLGGSIEAISRRFRRLDSVIGLICILALALQTWLSWQAWSQVDASHDQRAEAFGQAVLTLAPEDAIVFANGDQAVFSLWYFQYALRERTDLAVIASDLLQFPWYLQSLQYTYPNLNIPGPFPFPSSVVAANPDRPVCYVQYVQAPEINCLPVRIAQK